MSKARPIIANRIYLVQRRCSERRFFLKPSDNTNNAFWYCLGFALKESGVELLSAVAMSNHHHVVVRDVDGKLPEFLHLFHLLLARCQNAYLGRWESFWAGEQTSFVELVNDEDVIAKCAYALANPVSAGLVDTAAHWPGASSWSAMQTSRSISATRPHYFFRDGMPEKIDIDLAGLNGMHQRDFANAVSNEVRAIEERVGSERLAAGKRTLGRRAVLKQSHFAKPSSHEPRRTLSPRVACRSKWHRIEALARNKTFLSEYCEARQNWLAGKKPSFPVGTWALRHLAATRAPPPA